MHITTRRLCLTLATVLSLAASAATRAADTGPESAAPADPAAVQQELDEIMVRGTRVRAAIADAEDEFFRLYNSLNKDDDYSTSCVFLPLGDTQIRTHVCIPGFMADAMADQVYFGQQCARTAAACYTPPAPQQVLSSRSGSYANHLLKTIRSDERLGTMAGRLDNLYYELVSIQQQYVKLKTERAPGRQNPSPRVQ